LAAIQLKNIRKRYGDLDVIHQLDLAINDGEFIVVVGPSGCGKSTLLRMIAGLETISGGQLVIGEKVANDLPPQKRNIAMVFQTYALFPHMTVEENIAFGPQVRGESKEETKEKVLRAADVLNIRTLLGRRPAELSGGQRQRVAMGRSIVRNSDVFLFDEPLSNLDAHLRVEMRTEIKALHQSLNATIVYVTHDQIEAMTMASRIVIMNSGRIEQVGPPTELYDRPVNKFVAGFLGSPAMNFIPARLSENGKHQKATLKDNSHLAVQLDTKGETNVTLGIRPEAFLIDPNGPLRMHVEVIEPTGAETLVYGYITDLPVRCVFKGRPAIDLGQTLALNVDSENVHVFDESSGVRL